jgi:hypothetical protein
MSGQRGEEKNLAVSGTEPRAVQPVAIPSELSRLSTCDKRFNPKPLLFPGTDKRARGRKVEAEYTYHTSSPRGA